MDEGEEILENTSYKINNLKKYIYIMLHKVRLKVTTKNYEYSKNTNFLWKIGENRKDRNA